MNQEQAVLSAAVPPITGVPTKNLGWSVFKSSAAQIAGRLFISISRLVVAGLIIRGYGRDLFGQYSLVFGILAIGDWLVDFGTTDVFVRDISKEPERGTRLMRVLTATKIVQIPASFAALAAILLIFRYPVNVVEAGLVGATSLMFFWGVIAYRVIFRVALTMERDVTAELLSVIAVIPLIAMVCKYGGGLIALAGCHVFSRAVYFGACYLFGRNAFRPSIQSATWHDVSWSIRSSAAIGVIGFLVGGYETLDIILLSKFGSFSQLAYYSAAQRLIWPALMALAAVAATFYPVIASYWPHSLPEFKKASQTCLDIVFTLAGFVLCSTFAGAEFFMGLLGPELKNGAPVLRVLALLCFVKAISSSVGPVFYVVKAQKQALTFIAFALVLKAVVISVLAPRYGYMGVAYSSLAVEICVTTAAVLLIDRIAGYRVKWNIILRVTAITIVAVLASRLLFSTNGFLAAITAPALYIPLVFLSGTVNWSETRSLLWNR